MTRGELIGELFGSIGRLMREHPDIQWEDMYTAVHEISDYYKHLKSMPSVESKQETK